jgi:hypothetical protein
MYNVPLSLIACYTSIVLVLGLVEIRYQKMAYFAMLENITGSRNEKKKQGYNFSFNKQ